jgi:hypothetical protein
MQRKCSKPERKTLNKYIFGRRIFTDNKTSIKNPMTKYTMAVVVSFLVQIENKVAAMRMNLIKDIRR